MTHDLTSAARLSGVPRRTLQRWHERGLLPASLATAGGQRRYSDADVARAKAMHALRRCRIGPTRAARILDALGVFHAEHHAIQGR
jgi:DNA-binding transcriptional MerR regulator